MSNEKCAFFIWTVSFTHNIYFSILSTYNVLNSTYFCKYSSFSFSCKSSSCFRFFSVMFASFSHVFSRFLAFFMAFFSCFSRVCYCFLSLTPVRFIFSSCFLWLSLALSVVSILFPSATEGEWTPGWGVLRLVPRG